MRRTSSITTNIRTTEMVNNKASGSRTYIHTFMFYLYISFKSLCILTPDMINIFGNVTQNINKYIHNKNKHACMHTYMFTHYTYKNYQTKLTNFTQSDGITLCDSQVGCCCLHRQRCLRQRQVFQRRIVDSNRTKNFKQIFDRYLRHKLKFQASYDA
jgi:hypothetical protein